MNRTARPALRIPPLGVGVFVLAMGVPHAIRADHFAGASITYQCVGTNQYRIDLDLILNCVGAPITTQTLNFANSCGTSFSIVDLPVISSIEISPLCASQVANSTCNGGTQPGFKKYRFQTTLFLSPCNFWTIAWNTCCRNVTQNISGTPGLYVSATLNNAGGLCDASPVFVDSGIPYVCVNQPVAYNPGVSDADGNSLTYSLISARYAAPAPTNVSYQGSYSGNQPFLGTSIDPATGQLYFTPTATGYYVIVIQVASYNGVGQLIGRVMRDLMFVVITCDGTPPITSGISSSTGGSSFTPAQFIVCNGSSFCFSLTFTDPESAQVVSVASNATSVLPGSTFTVTGTNPAVATVCWTGNEAQLPMSVWFQASDNACPIVNSMSTFATGLSCVFLPIELLELQVRDEGGEAVVEWTTGSEQGNARFEVQRSADGSSFNTIGAVPAAGPSVTSAEYSFKDGSPCSGTSYYRLRIIDQDGTSSTSALVPLIRSVSTGATATSSASGWLLSALAPGSTWEFFDISGRTLSAGSATSDILTVPFTNSTGAVVLVVRSDEGTRRWVLPAITADERTFLSVRSR